MPITRPQAPMLVTKKVRAAIMAFGAVGVVGAALASGGVASAAKVVPTATPAPSGSLSVTDPATLAGGTSDAETVKKGARINGADRAKLAGEQEVARPLTP